MQAFLSVKLGIEGMTYLYETVPFILPPWEGLGFLTYSLASHYRSDHPESPAVERQVQYFIQQKMLFKALHDGEVIMEIL